MADETELHIRGYNETVDAIAAAERGISEFYSKQRWALTQHTQYWDKLSGQLAQAQQTAQKSTQKTREELGYFTRQLDEIQGRLLNAFSVVAIAEFTRRSVESFANFDRALQATQGLTQATAQQMDELKDKLYELEKQTGQTAEKGAEYQRRYVSQVKSLGADAANLYAPIQQSASLLQTDIGEMSAVSVAAMNNLKIPPKEFEEVLREITNMLPGMAQGFGSTFSKISRELESHRIEGARSAKEIAAVEQLLAPEFDNAAQAGQVFYETLAKGGSDPRIQAGMREISAQHGTLTDVLRMQDRILSNQTNNFQNLDQLRKTGYSSDQIIVLKTIHENLQNIDKIIAESEAKQGSLQEQIDKRNKDAEGTLNAMTAAAHHLEDALGKVAARAAEPMLKNLTDNMEKLTDILSGKASITDMTSPGGLRNLPSAPGHQAGGIINQPSLGTVGESGPEAVIPMADLQRARERDQAEQQRSANEQQQKDQAEAATASRIHQLAMRAKAAIPFHDWDDMRKRSDDTSGGDGDGGGGGGSSGGGGASGSWGGGGGRRGGGGDGSGGGDGTSGTEADSGATFGTTTPGTGQGAPGLTTPVTASSSGQVDPAALYNRYVTLFRGSKLEGFKPKDGAEFGITTGSAEEYARFALAITMQENSMSAKVNVHGGLNQFAQQDIDRWVGRGANVADPDVQAQALANVFKKFIPQDGVITNPQGGHRVPGMGAGQYFGSVRRDFNGPGIDIIRQGHLKQAGVVAAKVGAGDGSTFNPLFTMVNPHSGEPIDLSVLQEAAKIAGSTGSHQAVYDFIKKQGMEYTSGENCAEFVTAVLAKSEHLPQGVLPAGVSKDYPAAESYMHYGVAVPDARNAQPGDVMARHDAGLSHAMLVGPGGYDPKTGKLNIVSANNDRNIWVPVDQNGKLPGMYGGFRIGHLEMPKKPDSGGWSPGTGQFQGFEVDSGPMPGAVREPPGTPPSELQTALAKPEPTAALADRPDLEPVTGDPIARLNAAEKYDAAEARKLGVPQDVRDFNSYRPPSQRIDVRKSYPPPPPRPAPAPTPSAAAPAAPAAPAQPASQAASDAAADPSKAAASDKKEAAGPPLSLKSTPSQAASAVHARSQARRRMQDGGFVLGSAMGETMPAAGQPSQTSEAVSNYLERTQVLSNPVTDVSSEVKAAMGEPREASVLGNVETLAKAALAVPSAVLHTTLGRAYSAITGMPREAANQATDIASVVGPSKVTSPAESLLERAKVGKELGKTIKGASDAATGDKDYSYTSLNPMRDLRALGQMAVQHAGSPFSLGKAAPSHNDVRAQLSAPIRPEIEAPRPPSRARMLAANRRAARQQDHWTSNAETRFHRYKSRADTGAI
jgi:hypothetical protein